MNEDEARRMIDEAAESLPPMSLGPTQELIRGGRRVQRRHRLMAVGSVTATVALVVGGATAWLPGSTGSADAPAVDEQTAAPLDLPIAPEGTRWVGHNGVMVAVPDRWSTNDTRCGQPLSDTVDFSDSGAVRSCLVRGSERFSVLRPIDLSSPVGDIWLDIQQGDAVTIDGTPARRTSYCLVSDPPDCSSALVVPSVDAVFVAEFQRNDVAQPVLESARLVPDGYTAVPSVVGLGADEDVDSLMSEAGLEWTPRCPSNAGCEIAVATEPQAGTVVPEGTTVTAVDSRVDALSCAGGRLMTIVDKAQPRAGTSLGDAMVSYLVDATTGGESYVVVARAGNEAEVEVLDDAGVVVALVVLTRWDNGSWSTSEVTQCAVAPEPKP